jgi:hypothetical protein
MPKYEGLKVRIGEDEFIIPPLNFFRLKKVLPLVDKLKEVSGNQILKAEEMEDFITIIHLALSRNYPEVTVQQVEEMVDLGNLRQILAAVLGISGFVQGEKPAGSESTGIKSTPT